LSLASVPTGSFALLAILGLAGIPSASRGAGLEPSPAAISKPTSISRGAMPPGLGAPSRLPQAGLAMKGHGGGRKAVHRRLPLTKAGLIEWSFIPVQVPLEALFAAGVDTKKPYDRTTAASATLDR